MASSTARKLCQISSGCKQPVATNCEGCSQALCTKHFLEHRRLLSEEMDFIVGEHDNFRETLNHQSANPNAHPLIEQVNRWETESIAKIKEHGEKLRAQLLQLTKVHLEELLLETEQLSRKIKEARGHESFVETDLSEWQQSLSDLKSNLTSPRTFTVNHHDTHPLVQRISVDSIETNESFERVFDDNVRIEEQGQVAVHNASNGVQTEVRGKLEYVAGCRRIRLHIEHSANVWLFLGINTKATPLQPKSYSSPSAYGWSSNNYLWSKGGGQQNVSQPPVEMKTNDVISLTLDCDHRRIVMVNERTNATYEIRVDINCCPFPWQLHVILHELNSRVRILPK